jgi:hypothetical protein
MIIKATSPLFGGWQGPAEITTQPPVSRYREPVLVVAGHPVDRVAAHLAGYRLIEANDAERGHLARAGYPL